MYFLCIAFWLVTPDRVVPTQSTCCASRRAARCLAKRDQWFLAPRKLLTFAPGKGLSHYYTRAQYVADGTLYHAANGCLE